MREIYKFTGEVVLPDRLSDAPVLVEDGKILDAAFSGELPSDIRVTEVTGARILPGFIDLHVHGGGGCDLMDDTPDAIRNVVRTHCAHGTTAMLPTTMSSPAPLLYRFFERFRNMLTEDCGAELLGVHMEGPYLSLKKCGAQPPWVIREPNPVETSELLERGGDLLKYMSLAPEINGARELTETLRRRGILVGCVHSDAEFADITAAREWGVSHIAHFYNSSTMYGKRGQRVCGGIVEAGFFYDDITIELIGDGRHIPSELMRLCVKLKGSDHVVLITDAIRAAGTDAAESFLGSLSEPHPIIIEDGVAKLPDRSFFAGSIATADRLWKTAVGYGIPLTDVCRMMSDTPAAILGISDRKGGISKGHDADLVVTDRDFNVQAVFVKGVRKF